jgi:hypothetical protein
MYKISNICSKNRALHTKNTSNDFYQVRAARKAAESLVADIRKNRNALPANLAYLARIKRPASPDNHDRPKVNKMSIHQWRSELIRFLSQ